MRYLVISDVHSCFDKMMDALNKANFNKDKDCLISNGDLFDRGDKPLECLQFIMSLPHKILLFGNHELELMRFIKNSYPKEYDFQNMTTDTLLKLAGVKDLNFRLASSILRNMDNGISKLLDKYLNSCHYAAEFDKYVITHGWLPCRFDDSIDDLAILPEWDLSTKYIWYDACWANAINRCNSKAFLKDKLLILGHTHSWRVAMNYGVERIRDEQFLDSSPYAINGKVWFEDGVWKTDSKYALFIDGAAPYEFGGQVNVFEIRSRSKPKLIDAIPEYKYEILDD